MQRLCEVYIKSADAMAGLKKKSGFFYMSAILRNH